MTATVEIETYELGDKRHKVLILRPGAPIPRTLWGSYATWTEAAAARDAARAYLVAPDDQKPGILDRLVENQETEIQPIALTAADREFLDFRRRSAEAIVQAFSGRARPSPPDFRPGDIVTRDGTDEQLVLGPQPSDQWFGTILQVRCIKAPASGWCAVGDLENNLPGRYQLVRRPDIVPTEMSDPSQDTDK